MTESGPTPAGRPLPWTRLVEALGEKRFEEVREALAGAKIDPLDRDAFLLNGAVGQLLRELVPQEGAAAAVNAYGALLQMLYAHWDRGWPVARVPVERLRAALDSPTPYTLPPTPFLSYLQLPLRLLWAEPEAGAPHEPLDGLFVVSRPPLVWALAVLGFRPEREGFTTIECVFEQPAPLPGARPDGSAAFASLIPGGDRAGLHSLADPGELAALASFALSAVES